MPRMLPVPTQAGPRQVSYAARHGAWSVIRCSQAIRSITAYKSPLAFLPGESGKVSAGVSGLLLKSGVAKGEHCFGHFDKTRYVGAGEVVDMSRFVAVLDTAFVNVKHRFLEQIFQIIFFP